MIDTRFRHADASVDGVLCWDFFDFLDKASTQALAQQMVRMLRPGGAVMGFFCTAARTDHVPFTKYEIVDDGSLRHRVHPAESAASSASAEPRHHPDVRRPRRVRSFLLKNNIREMLLLRARLACRITDGEWWLRELSTNSLELGGCAAGFAPPSGHTGRLRGKRPSGAPHSLWQIVEHLRLSQHDILDFCVN